MDYGRNTRLKGGGFVAITVKKELFMLALVTEPNVRKAYEKANISNNTAYKWLNDKEFQSAFTQFKREMMRATTARLQSHTTNAVDVLSKIMVDENAPANARVQSVRTILEYAYKGVELEDISERVERLERNLINDD